MKGFFRLDAPLKGRRVLLGISAGIAAYKTPQLVRRLKERGASVRVILTPSAMSFVTPLSLQAVSGLGVSTDLLDPSAEAAMGHIELARWADLLLIAPATANLLARLRGGMADDLLSTVVLASSAPLALAPAMNQQMWANPATVDNVSVLRDRGAQIWGPAEGQQACGDEGAGRMLEPTQLADCVTHQLLCGEPKLIGSRVLISAGPTLEDLDPVRYVGNRSSGRMGFALAGAAKAHGAEVTLVAGPVNLETPAGVTRVNVRSARDMHQEIIGRAIHSDIYVGAAAVADFRPDRVGSRKMKKSGGSGLELKLVQNPDILKEIAGLADGPYTVGFAAETHDLESFARGKLASKGADLIAANQVGIANAGFDAPGNALTVFGAHCRIELPQQSKVSLAHQFWDHVAEQMEQR
ncbi:MAG: bifunctional phosphopantothenoylcysteine decarboxylase/phosphopantothenate--cysteine ligase CoaBC [Lysobacterales bacterium]